MDSRLSACNGDGRFTVVLLEEIQLPRFQENENSKIRIELIMATSGPIVIAGGSGFLGSSLARYLSKAGHAIVLLSRRNPPNAVPGQFVKWDGRSVGDWSQILNGASGLVNLVGRSVDCIKTADHRDEILRSRVESVNALGTAMRTIEFPPPVWVQMSTAHIYGDPPEVECTEDSSFGYGLAPDVARAWEDALRSNLLPSQRGVIFRTSFVIGRDQGSGGGAISRLRTLVRLGLGGTVGTGKQGMSWLHETDMNRLFERALMIESMRGVYIASSPQPVSQREFMKEMRKAMRIPIGLPASEWMVRIGAPLLMRTDPELALYGRYVVSKRLRDENFKFLFPDLPSALADVFA